MSEYIPLEIQREILKRLPLKPLIRFRSVSKPWKCLIDDPDFIVAFGVRRQPPQAPQRFIFSYTDHVTGDKYLSLADNDDGGFVHQELVPTVPDLIKSLKHHRDDPTVVGSSHGLLCLKGCYNDPDGKEMVVVWNPSIRKSVGIQAPDMYDLLNKNLDCYGEYDIFGFGVCPITLDPIVCKIKYIFDYTRKMKERPGVSAPWLVQVFTLSTGTWSNLSTNLPRESIRVKESQVVIGRFIYWLAFDILDEDFGSQAPFLPFLIMSFDLTTKEFKEIKIPRLCSIQTISKLRESLVLLEYPIEYAEDVSVCCLWMMKEQGDRILFRKLININLLPDVTINGILGCRKTGELILETQQLLHEDTGKLEVYDPNSKSFDNLGIDGYEYSFFMCSYMETLLLHDQLDGFIYSISN